MITGALPADREEFAARLATTAYEVALRHGVRGSFADLELDLWHELRAAVASTDRVDEEGPRACPR